MKKRDFIKGLLLIIGLTLVSCSAGRSIGTASPTKNSKAALDKPYVILISLDGFRWDYVEKYKPPHLRNFIDTGVKAESLIPSFPSKTFPNHYTIATGMYPDNHGLLGNSFYSTQKKLKYSIGNREMVEDGTFYGGSPIWVQAAKAGMVTASYFFVGSEANIQGMHPTYYFKYDGATKNETRVTQVLDWLAMHAKKRPHMITMYFSDMDDVGHRFSPDNDALLEQALMDLDEQLGVLFEGVAATGLPVNMLIVSDHGMATLETTNFIALEDIANDSLFLATNNGALVNIYPRENISTDTVFQYLKEKEANFNVYLTESTPEFEYMPTNKDWGPIQVIPDIGYYFSSQKRMEAVRKNNIKMVGVHGYDPKLKDMHGIFYGKGPAFKNGAVIPAVKNIHIYPLMCEILGLPIPEDIDGNLQQMKPLLVHVDEQKY
ncbi:MAG: ectonucleotide pyrophosphatase/phosphodiesterase [Croceitalea sp.]|nr:ectonucleotide pyrophosphatase/phosphodiesterase [Croceitalea sp.]